MTAFFTNDKDRKVKVFNNGVAVSSSNAQSEYARYLNFKENFTISTNTISGNKVYDIVGLGYAIPHEGGVAQGSTNRPLNFNDSHFDITETTGSPGSYDISSTGRVKVNSISTIRPLNVVNTTNHTAVTVADNSGTDKIDLTFSNNDVDVLSEGTLVNTSPRRLNFSGFTVTDNSGSDRVDITGNFLPNVFGKRFGMFYGAQADLSGSFGEGLWNSPYTNGQGTVSGVNSDTHGHARRYKVGGSDDDLIECEIATPMTKLGYNPHIYLKMSGATIQDSRFFFGWHDSTIPTGSNEYLTNKSGFALTYQFDTAETEDTAWQINRNDGTGTEQKVGLGVNLNSATPFTVELVGDSANNRWGWNLNGGTFTYYTQGTSGNSPATATNLGFTFRIEQIGDGNDNTTIDFWYGYWLQDK